MIGNKLFGTAAAARGVWLLSVGAAALSASTGHAGNPIISNQGVNDPHIRIFGDTAYLYASHDKSSRNDTFIMEDWQVWSSADLVNWRLRSTLYPDQTYLRDQPGFSSAWATDAAERNGQYFWYYSEGNRQTGVVVGDSPVGPWRDVLGKPLLSEGLTPTHEYDPGLYAEGDERFIIFGVWDYYLARLGDDMISLAETPRKIEIRGARGPYTFTNGTPFDGKLTDDKPFLHRHGDLYYLSWGAFYATSKTLYGPYEYRGVVITDQSFPTGLSSPTWPTGPQQGRHGSFFAWHGQTYFAYCDISQSDNRYFRDTFISYVHYRADGSIAPIRVDEIGVGEYDADRGPIEAEDYFAADAFFKQEREDADNGFVVVPERRAMRAASSLTYPNIRGLSGKNTIVVTFEGGKGAEWTLSIGRKGAEGVIATEQLSIASDERQTVKMDLGPLGERESLVFYLSTNSAPGTIALDSFTFE